MPCYSPEPDDIDKEASVVAALLEELKTGILPDWYNDGYKFMYDNKIGSREVVEKFVPLLCSKLQKMPETTLKVCSLEMQMWWRDHQKTDKKRLEEEMKKKKEGEGKQKAIAKLTPYERKLLGL